MKGNHVLNVERVAKEATDHCVAFQQDGGFDGLQEQTGEDGVGSEVFTKAKRHHDFLPIDHTGCFVGVNG